MLNTFKDITETLHRGVSLGTKTKVTYQNAEGETTELFPSFPENLALAFSPALKTQRLKPHGKCIVLTESTPESYTDSFKWMLACAEAKKILQFPKFQGFVFYRTTRVLEAAKILSISDLVEAMDARLRSIASAQVHTDDIWKVYTDLACGNYKDMVVQSVARAIVEGRIRGASQLRSLGREMPHVNDDIKYEVDYLHAYGSLEKGSKLHACARPFVPKK